MMPQEQPSTPVTTIGGALSLAAAVIALVPRWLVVATGLVFLTWLGFDLYLNARQKLAQTENAEQQVKLTTEQAGIAAADNAIKTRQKEVITTPVHRDPRLGTTMLGINPPVQ